MARSLIRKEIEAYYQEKKRAQSYFLERYVRPIGRFINERQVTFINGLIAHYHVETLVDLGTGPARIAKFLCGFKRGIAVDQSGAMLKIARRELSSHHVADRWRLVRGNIFRLPLSLKPDLVICFKVIRHYPLKDRKKIYAQLRNIMDQKTLFVMDVPNIAIYKTQTVPVYDASWTKKEIIRELVEAGFRVHALKPIVHYFYLQNMFSALSKFGFYTLPYWIIRFLEMIPGRKPYEWIVCVSRRS